MGKSILDTEKGRCFICGRYGDTQKHHIFFGNPNRRLSEADGMFVYLCLEHHTGSNEAVHCNRENDLELKQIGQREWESRYGDRDAFIKRYGKNYLED